MSLHIYVKGLWLFPNMRWVVNSRLCLSGAEMVQVSCNLLEFLLGHDFFVFLREG